MDTDPLRFPVFYTLSRLPSLLFRSNFNHSLSYSSCRLPLNTFGLDVLRSWRGRVPWIPYRGCACDGDAVTRERRILSVGQRDLTPRRIVKLTRQRTALDWGRSLVTTTARPVVVLVLLSPRAALVLYTYVVSLSSIADLFPCWFLLHCVYVVG